MSMQGYATCHRSSPKGGHRLTNMREAVTAAQSTAGMASAAGSMPLRAQPDLSTACCEMSPSLVICHAVLCWRGDANQSRDRF